MNILSDQKRKNLILDHKNERDSRVKDRIRSIILYDQGEPYEIIAKYLIVSINTVKKYISEYLNNNKLKPQNGGSESKLTDNQLKELSTHLEENTYTKVECIIKHIHQTYNILYSLSGLTKLLNRLGFTYKKLKGIPAKLDQVAQENFIIKYRELEKKKKKEEEIIFIDSCHHTQSTKLNYGWIKKGKEKQVKTTASRTRLNITGGINIETKEVISSEYDQINSESTIDFLKKVEKRYSKSKIKIHILPPYSPNLNPIERLWKLMNEHVRNNIYFESAKHFKSSIRTFFQEIIPKIPETLARRINSNFQRILSQT